MKKNITVIGAGRTGSSLILLLSKALKESKIEVYDFDRVEVHNISSQLYGSGHKGMFKVSCVKGIINTLGNHKNSVKIHKEKFHGGIEQPLDETVVLTVDSLSERKRIFNVLIQRHNISLIIDLRLGYDFGMVMCIKPVIKDSIKDYYKTLEGIPENAPCGIDYDFYKSMLLSSVAVSMLLKYFNRQDFIHKKTIDYNDLVIK